MQGTVSQRTAHDRDLGRVERPLEAAVVSAALLTIPLTILQEQAVENPLFVVADWSIWAVFLLDLILRVHAAHDRWAGLRRQWLSVIVVVLSFPATPGLLALVRLARLTRVARVIRLAVVMPKGLTAIRHILSRQGVVAAAGTTGLLILAGAGMLLMLEPETVAGGFGDGVWWGVVTAATVGYGDITPQTPLGRLAGVAIMIAGVGLFSMLAASAAAYFVNQDDESEQKAMIRRLDAISDRLDRLERILSPHDALPQMSNGKVEEPATNGPTHP